MGELKNEYNAIILAAGYGSRISDLTSKPKCLLEIQNKSLIENTINNLLSLGIANIYLAIGYKKELIIKKLRIYNKVCKIHFIDIKNYKKVGSSVSWYNILKKYREKKDIIFLHADLFYDKKLLKTIIRDKRKNIIGCVKKLNNKVDKYSFVIKHKKFKLLEINHKYYFRKTKKYLELACISKFSKETMEEFKKFLKLYIINVSKGHTWEYPFNTFIKKTNIKFYINKKNNYFWYNINKSSDYFLAQKKT